MTALVRYEVRDKIGTITLDSPANRNALSKRLLAELGEHVGASRLDDSTVVLIRSSERVFCSGGDLAEAAAEGMEKSIRTIIALQRAILTHPKPVVTRVDGPVRAGGLGIVASSDVVMSATDANFAFTESRLGLAPAAIALTVVPRLSSRAASDTFLSGRTFGAAEAAAMGLVTATAPAEQLDEAVASYCGELLAAHPQGLAVTKRILNRPLVERIDEYGEEMATLSAKLFASDPAREAMAAFLKR